MRRLVSALLGLALLVALAWGAGALALRQGADSAVKMLRDQGRGDAGALTVAGFPSAFSVTLAAPKLHQGLIAWQGDWLRFSLPSYAPWRWRLDIGAAQSLRLGFLNYLISGDDMRADLAFRPDTTLALENFDFSTGQVSSAVDGGGKVFGAESLALSLTAAGGFDYRLEARLAGFSLPTQLQPAYALAEQAEVLEARVLLGLSAPIDRNAQDVPPNLQTLTVEGATLRWGAAELHAEGALHADATGLAEGQIALRSPDWRAVVDLALALRLVQPRFASTLARDLEPLADAQGGMAVNLAFRSGQIWLGPVLLGPSPYLQ
ncbi:DUF2125 domain-containing protein [Phaeovulum sp.]|uniref:DUF2125 domain-containing protein n=1 Tax=Phaeovulum sp. TaxID=2934796 RepID=UPI0035628003